MQCSAGAGDTSQYRMKRVQEYSSPDNVVPAADAGSVDPVPGPLGQLAIDRAGHRRKDFDKACHGP